MEEYYRASSELESDSEDTLSLCDLPLQNGAVSETSLDSLPPHSPDAFEFAVADGDGGSNADLDAFIFGGAKSESKSTAPIRSQDPFLSRSESFDGKRIVSRSSGSSSSSRSMSRSGNSGRRHKVLFGLAKFPAEMELGDMRKRQSRRAPAPMFPAEAVAAAEVSGGGRRGGSRWSLVRLLRWRAHSATALARASIGRMRLV